MPLKRRDVEDVSEDSPCYKGKIFIQAIWDLPGKILNMKWAGLNASGTMIVLSMWWCFKTLSINGGCQWLGCFCLHTTVIFYSRQREAELCHKRRSQSPGFVEYYAHSIFILTEPIQAVCGTFQTCCSSFYQSLFKGPPSSTAFYCRHFCWPGTAYVC